MNAPSPLGIVDGHNDLAWALRNLNGYDLQAYPLDVRQDRTRTDLVRLAEGGVGGQFWSVYVPFSTGTKAVTATLEQIDFVLRMIGHYPDRLMLALTADDVERAASQGRIASLLGARNRLTTMIGLWARYGFPNYRAAVPIVGDVPAIRPSKAQRLRLTPEELKAAEEAMESDRADEVITIATPQQSNKDLRA